MVAKILIVLELDVGQEKGDPLSFLMSDILTLCIILM
jgi:hypothetical protein